MRPKGLTELKSTVQLEDPFADQYTVRALFPQNSDELEKKGFYYSLFRELGANKSNKEFAEYPLMAITLINVSEDFVRKFKGLDELNAQMMKFVDESLGKQDRSTLKCAVFPSIGYSDYIVAFMSKDFEQIEVVIDKLRTKHFDDGAVAFSSFYTVCGFYSTNPSGIANNKNVHLSIRVNLREGISAKYFMGEFKKAAEADLLSKGFDNARIKELFLNWDKEYYGTFGNSDSLFLPEHNLDAYLPLYLDGFILNPGNSFFKEHITNIRTSIRVNGRILNDYGDPYDAVIDKKKGEIITNYHTRFIEFIDRYEEFVKKNDLHIRIAKSLHQLMKNYLNIAQMSHCFDVEKILGEAFLSLIDNMEYVFKNADTISQRDVDIVLNEFRNIMGVYLSDLIRSDKLFIEGQTLTHPSIGSATKLLFAYNHLTKQITEKLIEMEHNPIEKFNFFITSGGCDKTISAELFEFLGIRTNCLNLVIITIPEMSLYDVKGTLFRLAHEFMHFCGERKRKVRLEHILEALFCWTAVNICDIYFNEDEFSRILSYINPYFDKASIEYKDILYKVTELYMKMKKECMEQIAGVLRSAPYFTEYGYIGDDVNERPYYLFEIETSFLNERGTADVFLGDVMEEGTVQDQIYHVLDCQMNVFYERIIKMLETNQIYYSALNAAYLSHQYNSQYKEKDSLTAMFIKVYFQIYMDELDCPKAYSDMRDVVWKYRDIRENIFEAMREGYADCMAAKILNIEFTDFIYAFVYEQWNMEASFPDTAPSILRIGADLKILFGLSGELETAYANQIRDKAQYWKNRGYEYKNIDQLIMKIDHILQQYDKLSSYGLTIEIETYLNKCITEMDLEQFKEVQELCKGIR